MGNIYGVAIELHKGVKFSYNPAKGNNLKNFVEAVIEFAFAEVAQYDYEETIEECYTDPLKELKKEGEAEINKHFFTEQENKYELKFYLKLKKAAFTSGHIEIIHDDKGKRDELITKLYKSLRKGGFK